MPKGEQESRKTKSPFPALIWQTPSKPRTKINQVLRNVMNIGFIYKTSLQGQLLSATGIF